MRNAILGELWRSHQNLGELYKLLIIIIFSPMLSPLHAHVTSFSSSLISFMQLF